MADTYLPPGFKKCKSCQQVKPFEQFGKELKGKFGLKSKCRACISEKNKTYAALMNPLMILVKIIKLRWIHILSYDQ
ncbi:hypothetical protein P3S20_24430, partial [Enterobacter hormaechei]|nr:hypothetical protein [Enterobacter hormaechei]MDF3587717.1 hypothetical protein [Enterobacter hormaechei]